MGQQELTLGHKLSVADLIEDRQWDEAAIPQFRPERQVLQRADIQRVPERLPTVAATALVAIFPLRRADGNNADISDFCEPYFRNRRFLASGCARAKDA